MALVYIFSFSFEVFIPEVSCSQSNFLFDCFQGVRSRAFKDKIVFLFVLLFKFIIMVW